MQITHSSYPSSWIRSYGGGGAGYGTGGSGGPMGEYFLSSALSLDEVDRRAGLVGGSGFEANGAHGAWANDRVTAIAAGGGGGGYGGGGSGSATTVDIRRGDDYASGSTAGSSGGGGSYVAPDRIGDVEFSLAGNGADQRYQRNHGSITITY